MIRAIPSCRDMIEGIVKDAESIVDRMSKRYGAHAAYEAEGNAMEESVFASEHHFIFHQDTGLNHHIRNKSIDADYPLTN